MAGTESVTVVRPPPRGRFGDPEAGSAVTFVSPGWQFAPGQSTEGPVGTNTVDTDATIYGPPDSDVLATDRIIAREQLFVVVGDPQFWSFGTVVVLRKVTG